MTAGNLRIILKIKTSFFSEHPFGVVWSQSFPSIISTNSDCGQSLRAKSLDYLMLGAWAYCEVNLAPKQIGNQTTYLILYVYTFLNLETLPSQSIYTHCGGLKRWLVVVDSLSKVNPITGRNMFSESMHSVLTQLGKDSSVGRLHLKTVMSPIPGVVGPLPNGLNSWLINGGDPNYTYKSWDDPPSRVDTIVIN